MRQLRRESVSLNERLDKMVPEDTWHGLYPQSRMYTREIAGSRKAVGDAADGQIKLIETGQK